MTTVTWIVAAAVLGGTTTLAVASTGAPDSCQPHGETNVLTHSCWGAGGSPGCFSCYSGAECTIYNASRACLVDASRNSFLLWQS